MNYYITDVQWHSNGGQGDDGGGLPSILLPAGSKIEGIAKKNSEEEKHLGEKSYGELLNR